MGGYCRHDCVKPDDPCRLLGTLVGKMRLRVQNAWEDGKRWGTRLKGYAKEVEL